DGADAYIDTGIDPSAGGTRYSLSPAHVGVYLTDVGSESSDNIAIGQVSGASRTVFYPRLTEGRSGFRLNMSSSVLFENPRQGDPGFYLLTRTGNTARVVLDNEQIYSGANIHPPDSVPAGNIMIGGNLVTMPDLRSDGVVAGWSVGNTLAVGAG